MAVSHEANLTTSLSLLQLGQAQEESMSFFSREKEGNYRFYLSSNTLREKCDAQFPPVFVKTQASLDRTDTERSVLPGIPESAICVQRFDDSLNSAIRITYRISLRSSSLREPRYPLLRVVL